MFTDLDGTLLDHGTYDFEPALPALDAVRQREIPLVFCSSKTRAEIEYWREKLDNVHPFISENGGGIFIPRTCFLESHIQAVWPNIEMMGGYFAIVLGKPYSDFRRTIQELRESGFEIKGFGDMSPAEVADITGLSMDQARLAKKREFDETFLFVGDQAELTRLVASIAAKGLRHSQGKFYHLMGDNDKGKAVEILKRLYGWKFDRIISIGLGDSPVDFPMLEKVDHPVLVKNYKGEYDPRIKLPNLIKAEGIGPEGWNKAVLTLIQGRP